MGMRESFSLAVQGGAFQNKNRRHILYKFNTDCALSTVSVDYLW